jgi:hypothetical protein
MTKGKKTHKTENTEIELGGKLHNWGETPSEVIQGILLVIQRIVSKMPDITRDDVCDAIKKQKKNNPKLDIYGWAVHKYVLNKPFDFMVAKDFYDQFSHNSKNVKEKFEGTEVFPVILEALGLILRLDVFHHSLYRALTKAISYCSFDKQEVINIFGEDALEYYDPDKVFTEDDDKIILGLYCQYFDYLQESESKKKLCDLAARIAAYKQFFLDPIDMNEIESFDAKSKAMMITFRKMRDKQKADFISSAIAVKEFCVSRATLQRAAKDGKIKKYKVRNRGKTASNLYSRKELEQFFEKKKKPLVSS